VLQMVILLFFLVAGVSYQDSVLLPGPLQEV
jgi:hypothetical protein